MPDISGNRRFSPIGDGPGATLPTGHAHEQRINLLACDGAAETEELEKKSSSIKLSAQSVFAFIRNPVLEKPNRNHSGWQLRFNTEEKRKTAAEVSSDSLPEQQL